VNSCAERLLPAKAIGMPLSCYAINGWRRIPS